MKNKTLIDLFNKTKDTSKYSIYQILPKALKDFIPSNLLSSESRWEQERLDFLKKRLDFNKKKILDIGGNTGFFSFESLDFGADQVVYFDGSEPHAKFVSKAAKILNKKITVFNRYFDFDENINDSHFDIVFLFNVIHHLGDDYGDKDLSIEKAKEKMAEYINFLHDKTDILVLQMGFCWKADTTKLLFKNGTKVEMIDFIKSTTQGKWNIECIGIAEVEENITIYRPLNEKNIIRNNKIREFRNRPIFILKSIK